MCCVCSWIRRVMMSGVGGDGFCLVKRRRGRLGPGDSPSLPPPLPRPLTAADFPDHHIDCVTAIRRIRAAKEDLLQSDYYKHFFNTLKESLSVIDRKEVVEIISFGLGHIGDCTISRYQLALILCLRDHFRVDCHVHDPIFYSNECQVLETLNFKLINENEEGRRTLRNDGITIVYLPHCPKQLTNNFLWNNWTTNLKNCVLIGNSFLRLIESQPHENLNISAPYILNIQPYTEEFSLVNSFKFNDVFNDTSIHVFPARTLSLITDNFWYRGESEPDYSNNVEFISSSIISRLRTGDPFEHGYI